MAATPAKTCEQVSSTLSSLTRKRLVPFCKDTFFLFSSGIVLSRSNFNYTRSPDISTMKAWSTAPPSGSYTQSRLLPLYKLGSSRSNKKQWCLVKQTLSNLSCLTCGIWMEKFLGNCSAFANMFPTTHNRAWPRASRSLAPRPPGWRRGRRSAPASGRDGCEAAFILQWGKSLRFLRESASASHGCHKFRG